LGANKRLDITLLITDLETCVHGKEQCLPTTAMGNLEMEIRDEVVLLLLNIALV